MVSDIVVDVSVGAQRHDYRGDEPKVIRDAQAGHDVFMLKSRPLSCKFEQLLEESKDFDNVKKIKQLTASNFSLVSSTPEVAVIRKPLIATFIRGRVRCEHRSTGAGNFAYHAAVPF